MACPVPAWAELSAKFGRLPFAQLMEPAIAYAEEGYPVPPMEIQVHHSQGVCIITLSGRWDTFSASAFEQKCAELVAEGMRTVVIDAAQVDYVSSFGLRSLLNLGKLLEPLKGRIHMPRASARTST